MVGFSFAPAGWMLCQGQLLPISENETLFQLIGTTYGGDGQETFNLPDLQGRVPLHMGTSPKGTTYNLGEKAGTESETLTTQQMPIHAHPFIATNSVGSGLNPAGALIGQPAQIQPFIDDNPTDNLNQGMLSPIGGSQPHENMMPFLCISFIISLFGIFPHQ